MEKEMKIYHVETQEDYDDLMIELENEGCMWASGDKPTDLKLWYEFEAGTVIYLGSWRKGELTQGDLSEAKTVYSTIPIIKHKAKGVENMEKVVVPQFVADWYEEYKEFTVYGLMSAFVTTTNSKNKKMTDWKELLGHENAQEVIAKMHLYGYEVEEEKKYYWRKKKEYLLGFETEDEVFLRYYYKKNKMYLGNRPVYLYLVPSYEPYKTKFTETEVRELVSEEDFKKLERVEIDDV